jgi:hypothetical protein
MRERIGLDRVHQAARIAGRRNQVMPSGGLQVPALTAGAGDIGAIG